METEAACGKARLTLHFPIWRKCHRGERESGGGGERTVNSSSRGAGAACWLRAARRRAPAGIPVAAHPGGRPARTARCPRSSPRLPELITVRNILFLPKCWQCVRLSNPAALVCNQHIYSHLGTRIRIKSPWLNWVTVSFPWISFKSLHTFLCLLHANLILLWTIFSAFAEDGKFCSLCYFTFYDFLTLNKILLESTLLFEATKLLAWVVRSPFYYDPTDILRVMK